MSGQSGGETRVVVNRQGRFADCESEYNRGAGCGKTARPDLCGGCWVTGIPTVNAALHVVQRPLGKRQRHQLFLEIAVQRRLFYAGHYFKIVCKILRFYVRVISVHTSELAFIPTSQSALAWPRPA